MRAEIQNNGLIRINLHAMNQRWVIKLLNQPYHVYEPGVNFITGVPKAWVVLVCLYPFFFLNYSLCVLWCACRGQMTTWSSPHLSILLGSNSGRQAHQMIDFTGWSHPASTFVNWRRKKQRLKKRCLSNIFSNPMTMRSDGSISQASRSFRTSG